MLTLADVAATWSAEIPDVTIPRTGRSTPVSVHAVFSLVRDRRLVAEIGRPASGVAIRVPLRALLAGRSS